MRCSGSHRRTNGANVVAVEIHQAATNPPAEFDLSFDLSLLTFAYNPGAALSITASNSQAIISWPDYLADWQLQQSTDLFTWTPLTNGVQRNAALFDIVVPIGPQGFFRLRQLP